MHFLDRNLYELNLRNAGADFIIDSINDLKNIFDDLFESDQSVQ